MRIGMVLDRPFPPDIRVEKEAATLQRAGHDVMLLAAPQPPGAEKIEADAPDLPVCFLPRPAGLRHLWNALCFRTTFHNPHWRAGIERFVREFKPDVLHVHDLPVLTTALAVARRNNLPLIADLHENFPALVRIWRESTNGLRALLTPGAARWEALERRIVGQAARLVVVVDEAKERLVHSYRLPPEKITVLMNVEDPERFLGISSRPELPKRTHTPFLIGYVGGVGKHRGIDVAIRAMAHLQDAEADAHLLVVGARKVEQVHLRRQAERAGVEQKVTILRLQPFRTVPGYIEASDICLVPHIKSAHTDHTIPHKLFHYMLAGKPVIVSDCAPLARIVNESGTGLVFASGDARDLARQIDALYRDRSLRAECGKAGIEAVRTRYNWEVEERNLVALYASLE